MRRPSFTSPGGLLRQGTMMAFTPMMSSIAKRRSKRRKGVASYGWDAPKGGAAEDGLETIDMPSDLADDGPAYRHKSTASRVARGTRTGEMYVCMCTDKLCCVRLCLNGG